MGIRFELLLYHELEKSDSVDHRNVAENVVSCIEPKVQRDILGGCGVLVLMPGHSTV